MTFAKQRVLAKKYASLSQRYDTYIISGSQISNDVACLWYYVNKHILHLYSKYSVYYSNLLHFITIYYTNTAYNLFHLFFKNIQFSECEINVPINYI